MIIFLFWMSLALIGSTHSASFQCFFIYNQWKTLGTVYRCDVQNAVSISSPDAAQIDSISGTHKSGYNNSNVEAISVYQKGQIHYFPRDLNNFFENLRGIEIYSTGLKEIHQRDLKDFPKLTHIYLWSSNLEILEKNLFKFNPNLEMINLNSNIIKHIDPNVFDNLIKFKNFWIMSNFCIDMYANANFTIVQNIIRTAQLQCTNLIYSNLEQQVKYLEFESQFLNSKNLKNKIETLDKQIKNSRFPNFFRENLKILNTDLSKKITVSGINDANDKLIVKHSKLSRIREKLEKIIETINNN